MGILVAQTAGSQVASAVALGTLVLPTTLTAGDMIYTAVCTSSFSTPMIDSISDNKSNVYTNIMEIADASNTAYSIWYAKNIAGGAPGTLTYTVNLALQASRIVMIGREYTNVGTTTTLDGTAQVAATTGTNFITGTITTTNPADLLVGLVSDAGTTGVSLPAGWLNPGTQNSSSTLMAALENKITTTTGNYAGTVFGSASQSTWNAAIAAFNAGSISYDTQGTFGQNSGSTYSFAHTVTGANPLITLLVCNGVSGSTTSVKFAGQAMTRIIIGTNSDVMELFYLVNPPTGLGTFNGTLDQTNIFSTVCVSNSYTGVNQTTPIGGSSSATASVVTSGSITLTTATNSSWIAGGLGITSVVAGTEDLTTGEIARGTATATGIEIRSVSNGPNSPAGPGTLRWTSASSTYIMLAAEINPAVAAATATTNQSFKNMKGIGNI